MFAKFNLEGITKNDEIFEGQDYLQIGKNLYNDNKREIEKDLDEFIREDGTIDGDRLQNSWFPQREKKFDVFLSHSHADQELAIQFSGWLYQVFGL